MANFQMHVANPDLVEVTLTVTMPIAQWKRLNEQLPSHWPSCDLARAIGDMVRQANVHFYPKIDTEA